MEFDPQKFFIGIIDLFSVLLPGAILTLVLGAPWTDIELDDAKGWTLFFGSSYVLGHFLFLIGSFLDNTVYRPLRDLTKETKLLQKKRLFGPLLQWIVKHLFKDGPDAAVTSIESIKNQYLVKIGDHTSINAFQWCKARLALEHPEVLSFVNRFEADSKFFRSFIPVIVGLLVLSVYLIFYSPREPSYWWSSLGLIFLLLLALWRYMDQRFKATQQAYWFILTLEANNLARTPEQERHE